MISVLLCVFNGERWLKECIESILNQTYQEFEFIIINDGSYDKSLSIIKKYAVIDNRIKYISQENIGLVKSLNKGLSIAKGEWIARIDSDDIACEERFQKQIAYAKKYNLGLVGCQFNLITRKGNLEKSLYIPTTHKKLFSNLIKQKIMFKHSSVIFRRNLVLKLGGYREVMKKSQDYDLWLRISEVSKIGCINYIGSYIRFHSKNISFNDEGIEQRLFAHCANVSHFLRVKYGENYDPIKNSLPNDNKIFIQFVKNELYLRGTIIFYKKLFQYKNTLEGSSIIKKYLFLIVYFNKPNLLIKLIRWLINGDFESKFIAKKWLKYKRKINLQT